MKRAILPFALLPLLIVLSACNSTTSTSGTGRGNAPLSTEAELLVGTLKLENTDLAVTADQAKTLLPLWQTLQSLSSSNTAATEEISSVVDQIKGTLTSQQVAKITAMKLTQQDMLTAMGQSGFSPNGASTTATPLALNGLPGSGNSGQGGPGGGFQGGGPAGGGAPPSGGFPGGDAGGFSGGPNGGSSTPQAVRPNTNQVPPPLLNAVIQLLQKKIQ